MEGGVDPERLGWLTFREVDLYLQRQRWLIENDWERDRLIVAALLHKKPTEIVKLSRDGQGSKKVWTQEEALRVLDKYKVKRPI